VLPINGETLPWSSMPTRTPATPPSAELKKNVNITTRSNGIPSRLAVVGFSATARIAVPILMRVKRRRRAISSATVVASVTICRRLTVSPPAVKNLSGTTPGG